MSQRRNCPLYQIGLMCALALVGKAMWEPGTQPDNCSLIFRPRRNATYKVLKAVARDNFARLHGRTIA